MHALAFCPGQLAGCMQLLQADGVTVWTAIHMYVSEKPKEPVGERYLD